MITFGGYAGNSLRAVNRGGNWNNGSNNGVFYINANNARSNSNTNIGGRSALALNANP